jgi:hypothetical protein
MNPLTHCQKILSLLIALALVVLAALTALPAGAAPPLTCGLTIRSLTDPYLGQFAEIPKNRNLDDHWCTPCCVPIKK